MSDMKTFTVRELDRQPAAVLDACDEEGEVRIRRRTGQQYTLRAEDVATRQVAWRKLVSQHRAHIQKIFPEPIPARQARLVDQLIGGE